MIAGALSFAHLHDLAEAAGQSGWKAWAYPVSVDLLLVAAWRRLRAGRDRSAWTWFTIALAASLGANVATAGLLDLEHVPAWLRILVAGWPALAFLGGTLLVHAPTPAPAASASEPEPDREPVAPEVEMHRTDTPDPASVSVPAAELTPAPSKPPADTPTTPPVPPALVDHARSIADAHRTATGEPITVEALTARLGLPAATCQAIAAQLQLT
ncbi:mobile element transfer protein [Streptomyces sp. F-3]|nr:mobile element transfer protein [Streptomyces sp. F-3]